MSSPSTAASALDTIVALSKRRGFVYQSADIYGGLNGVYDFGHLGSLMLDNIRAAWKHSVKAQPYGPVMMLEGALLAPEAVWKASGHVDNFHDPMVDCTACKKRFRADEFDLSQGCPNCGAHAWTDIRQFNMMFKTQLGATADSSALAYLRPETAQAIFVNFKNVYSTYRVKLPFGIAQIGKSFRNEITPKQFLFRVREFEQMELEWFCKPTESDNFFDIWQAARRNFYRAIGLRDENVRMRPHAADELAHYSKCCIDVEYQFPFGWKELEGIAHRSDFDLSQHASHSGKDLNVFDEELKLSYTPHVVECSVGTGRLFLALLFDAYHEDTLGGEQRVVLKLAPQIAPIKAAFLPLVKKLNEPMFAIYEAIARRGIEVEFDDSGSIGKRYRRHDEIGTPVCFTYDFDSQNDHCITARNRDTLVQERISIDSLERYLNDLLR